MYLRPGNLYKDFIIEENTATVGRTGRPQTSYNSEGNWMLKGALAEATPKQKLEGINCSIRLPIRLCRMVDQRRKQKTSWCLAIECFLSRGLRSRGVLEFVQSIMLRKGWMCSEVMD